MIKLNLETKNPEQERIKKYLEENVSKVLAEKINNGVFIEKEGKRLLNKKDLSQFWKYATDEARKIAEKGSQGAYVDDEKVFGWAIHFFEEDTIEGTLFNEDGSEFKPVKPKTIQTVKKEQSVAKKPDKKPQMQFSLFDLMVNDKQEDTTTTEEDDEEPSEEDIQEAIQIIREKESKPKGSPMYQKYMEIQEKYPDCIIAYRLGDFYEIFGENAKLVANKLDLTLTGRDCGLDERIPMVGFPYHCADNYIAKIIEFGKIAIVEQSDIEIKEKKNPTKIDYDTGEIFDLTEDEMREFDGDIYEPSDIDDNYDLDKAVKNIDKEIMLTLYNLLDGKMDIR